jgi:hypothetical protein
MPSESFPKSARKGPAKEAAKRVSFRRKRAWVTGSRAVAGRSGSERPISAMPGPPGEGSSTRPWKTERMPAPP